MMIDQSLEIQSEGRTMSILVLALLLLFSCKVASLNYNIYTFAGTGVASSATGKASSSAINQPRAVWQDTAFNFYIVETSGNCLRRIDGVTFVLSSFAGVCGASGSYSGDSGQASAAGINFPVGMHIDTTSRLYFTEYVGQRVRSVTTSRVITTFAGTGTAGSTGNGGKVTAATFNGPHGVWVSTIGSVYIVEYNSHYARVVPTNSIVSLLAGTGSGVWAGDGGSASSASLNGPERVFGNSVGSFFIADCSKNECATSIMSHVSLGNNRVRTISSSLIISTAVGTGTTTLDSDGQAATSTNVYFPAGIYQDQTTGELYVPELFNNRVRVKSYSTSLMSTFAGTGVVSAVATDANGDFGPATSATFGNPECIYIDSAGKIFVTEYIGYKVRLLYSVSPTSQPSSTPSTRPSCQPSIQPTSQPTMPTSQPTSQPTIQPSEQPSSQPTRHPTGQPSRQPSSQPSIHPTEQPSIQPSDQPTSRPTRQPSCYPSSQPSKSPTRQPSRRPSTQPSGRPSNQPTKQPTNQPSAVPTHQPSGQPSSQPVGCPSCQPSAIPSGQPSRQPSSRPTYQPTSRPTSQPSHYPSMQPSIQPSTQPLGCPSYQPSAIPSGQPTGQPSNTPSDRPTIQPSALPSKQPTALPTHQPSGQPIGLPTQQPSTSPSSNPTAQPSLQPMIQPTSNPSGAPSTPPSVQPSATPSRQPTALPSVQPSSQPSRQPSNQPLSKPSNQPSSRPSQQPTSYPSVQPSVFPSVQPSRQPVVHPTSQPSSHPTSQPFSRPSKQPLSRPSCQPSAQPSNCPTEQPFTNPTSKPSFQPKSSPSSQPSEQPTGQPSNHPSIKPSSQPFGKPTTQPSSRPSSIPSLQPSGKPSEKPTSQPTRRPSAQPSKQPTSQPSSQPFWTPSSQPSKQPIAHPSSQPSRRPTQQPTAKPTAYHTHEPTSQSEQVRYYDLISVTDSTGRGVRWNKIRIELSFVLPSVLSVVDGYADVKLTGAVGGQSFVVYSDQVMSMNVTSRTPSTQGFLVSPSMGYDYSARSVSSLGDVNGDGFNDLIIGVPYASRCYVMFGNAEVGYVNMSLGFMVHGASGIDLTGWSVSDAGDVNNDTFADILVGAPRASYGSVRSGAAYVLFGSDRVFRDVYLDDLSPEEGFVMHGESNEDCFGVSVAGAGDVNGDGVDDVLVGALKISSFYAGGAYIVFGGAARVQANALTGLSGVSVGNMSASDGVSLIGDAWSHSGCSVSGVGDINGDGFDDVLIGSAPLRRGSAVSSEVSYIVYGFDAVRLNVTSVKLSSESVQLVGGGVVVSGIADVNQDGMSDLLIVSNITMSAGVGYVMLYDLLRYAPSARPSVAPSAAPSTVSPTVKPFRSAVPSCGPVVSPSVVPTMSPTRPTAVPSVVPSGPSQCPTSRPSHFTEHPSSRPSMSPSSGPTHTSAPVSPTSSPTVYTEPPTTAVPSEMPSEIPSVSPSVCPSVLPSVSPTTVGPSVYPTLVPRVFARPTLQPTFTVTHHMYSNVSVVLDGSSGGSVNRTEYALRGNYVWSAAVDVSLLGRGSVHGDVITVLPNVNCVLVVQHFNVSVDVIDLRAFPQYTSMKDLNITRGSVIITLSLNQIVRLLSVNPSDMSMSNFVFFALKTSKPGQNAVDRWLVIGCVTGFLIFVVVSSVYRYYCMLAKWAKEKRIADALIARQRPLVTHTHCTFKNSLIGKTRSNDSDDSVIEHHEDSSQYDSSHLGSFHDKNASEYEEYEFPLNYEEGFLHFQSYQHQLLEDEDEKEPDALIEISAEDLT